jgi:hypothetical protein
MCQEERSVSWKVIVSVILNKKIVMDMYAVPNGFRERAFSLYTSKLYFMPVFIVEVTKLVQFIWYNIF